MRIRMMTVTETLATALAISLILLACAPAARAAEDAKKTAEAAATKAPASPQETLTQYVADLQKNPKDGVLRAKIIELVQKMDPIPAVPAEAKKFAARGAAAVEDAKSETDFREAAAEFEKVVNIAPWLGNGYRNLAIMQDKAGQYQAALNSLAWYLLTKPPAADADWANDLKAKIEYRKEKAAKDAVAEAKRKADADAQKAKDESPEAIATKKKQEYDEWLKKLDGAKFGLQGSASGEIDSKTGKRPKQWFETLVIRGSQVTSYFRFDDDPMEYQWGPVQIAGKTFSYKNKYVGLSTFTISDDGLTITRRAGTAGAGAGSVYHREGR